MVIGDEGRGILDDFLIDEPAGGIEVPETPGVILGATNPAEKEIGVVILIETGDDDVEGLE